MILELNSLLKANEHIYFKILKFFNLKKQEKTNEEDQILIDLLLPFLIQFIQLL